MSKLLIAGYGFLGKSLKQKFAAEGWRVHALNRSGEHGCRVCDLSDPGSVSLLEGSYDLIIHCAATRGGGEEAYRAVYLEGSRNLLRRFPDTPFIFTSSTSVYAQADHSDVSETSPATPSVATAQVLREAENLVLGAGGVVVRLSALCGPNRFYTFKSLMRGTARLDGSGERLLNLVHRDDVSQACYLLAHQWDRVKGQVFNVSSVSLRQRECYESLADHYHCDLPPVADVGQLASRRGSTSKRVLSSKLKDIGWVPEYPDVISIAESSEINTI
jgi:nucleoside-diphosphate-sugar epimerase